MMWNTRDILIKIFLIFLSIATFAFAQEPLTEFSDETLPLLNQQLTELRETLDAEIRDKDGDTKIQVEESADEDVIRIDTEGTERVHIDATSIDSTVDIDFNQNQALGMVIENLTEDPASPVSGQIWFIL